MSRDLVEYMGCGNGDINDKKLVYFQNSDAIILAREFLAYEIVDKHKMTSIQLQISAKCRQVNIIVSLPSSRCMWGMYNIFSSTIPFCQLSSRLRCLSM